MRTKMDDVKSEFARWIEGKFLDWQATQRERKSIEEFADWLGFKRPTVVQWMNDQRKPGPENIRTLALKLGLEAYDVLDLPRPDPELFRIEAVWEALPDQERIRLANLAEDLAGHARAGEPVRLGKAAPLKKARA